VNKPRTRAVLSAVLALACSPDGFTTGQLTNTADRCSRQPIPAMTRVGPLTISENSWRRTASQSPRFPLLLHPAASGLDHSSVGEPTGKKFFVPSWQASVNPRWAESRRTGVPSINTTRPSPKTCPHSWKTCALPGNKRQSFVDTVAVSA